MKQRKIGNEVKTVDLKNVKVSLGKPTGSPFLLVFLKKSCKICSIWSYKLNEFLSHALNEKFAQNLTVTTLCLISATMEKSETS